MTTFLENSVTCNAKGLILLMTWLKPIVPLPMNDVSFIYTLLTGLRGPGYGEKKNFLKNVRRFWACIMKSDDTLHYI